MNALSVIRYRRREFWCKICADNIIECPLIVWNVTYGFQISHLDIVFEARRLQISSE